jgi:hypothetical protein
MRLIKKIFLSLLLTANAGAATELNSLATSYAPIEKLGSNLYSHDRAQLEPPEAYLVVDSTGKPAIYLRQEKSIVSPKDFLLESIASSNKWKFDEKENIRENSEFKGWDSERQAWATFAIALKFQNSHCTAFRVVGPTVKIQRWISAKEMPHQLDFSKLATSSVPIPIEIMCIDGPKE